MANAAPTGITVPSPSFGPGAAPVSSQLAAVEIHESLAPFLGQPSRAAPPPPDPRVAMRDAAGQVEAYLDGSDFGAEPAALFTLGAAFGRQFDALRAAAADFSPDGYGKQRGTIFTDLATQLKARAAGLAKSFSRSLKDWPLMRQVGHELLLSKARPDVLSLAGTVAQAPPRFGLELLRQLIPADPADGSDDRQLIESVMATLWLRRDEWSSDPRLAEQMVAQFRRVTALYNDASYFGGYYIRLRLARAGSAWLAAANSLLQHGVLDPTFKVPLSLAFGAPEDPVALVEQSLPSTDATDTLTAFGLRPADETGRVGGSRSSEAVGPIRLGSDIGSRGT